MRNLLLCLVAVAALCGQSYSAAGSFPDRPVEAVVAWAPGGGSDLVFRAMAQVFPKYANGQPLLIKNIPGAAGVPGVVEFMKARPDGYTVAHWADAQTIKTHMSETPFTTTEFVPIAGIVDDNFYILVAADSPFKNLGDLIAQAKKEPGELTMGNAGVGGGSNMAQIQFERFAGIETNQVPFQGGGPMLNGLMSGQVESASQVVPEGSNNIKNGQIRILGIFSKERHPLFPDSPTAREQGIDLVINQIRGVVAPTGTPPEIADRLEEIFRQVTEDAEFRASIAAIGSNVAFLTAKEYAANLAETDKMYKDVIIANKLGDKYK
ncbi:MAG: tripartite tricarboxylate transporter substrate binding protein [Planctomycetota bacterium]|jgi:tripartite-type tricarboxylate transporter receptor subunit TctC|nr:tripartite tricarboxylate transporter substrate binding protein [Planctomycetota bacterium]